jgi:hypothetical protein
MTEPQPEHEAEEADKLVEKEQPSHGDGGDNREVIKDLRRAMQKMATDHERAMADILRRLEQAAAPNVTVHVQTPTPLPKIRLFNGLQPANNQECTYEEWRVQAKLMEKDEAVKDGALVLKRSLRGVALQQFTELNTSNISVVIKHFDKLFGCTKSAEDLYIDICQMRQGKESAGDFLTTLCDKLQTVKTKAGFDSTEFNRRLFLVFTKTCDVVLCRELRSRFGIPGDATPTFQEVLEYVRKVDDLEKMRAPSKSSPAVRAMAAQAEEFQADDNRPPRRPRYSQSGDFHATGNRPRGSPRYCYRCGLEGHFHANCQNEQNPNLVAERERQKRKHTNTWRERKGLAPLPLN